MKPYEIHVTIDPLSDTYAMLLWERVCKRHGFKPADLRKKNGNKSDADEFATAHVAYSRRGDFL